MNQTDQHKRLETIVVIRLFNRSFCLIPRCLQVSVPMTLCRDRPSQKYAKVILGSDTANDLTHVAESKGLSSISIQSRLTIVKLSNIDFCSRLADFVSFISYESQPSFCIVRRLERPFKNRSNPWLHTPSTKPISIVFCITRLTILAGHHIVHRYYCSRRTADHLPRATLDDYDAGGGSNFRNHPSPVAGAPSST